MTGVGPTYIYTPSVLLPHSVLFIILSGKAWSLFNIHTPTKTAMQCESGPSDSKACSYELWRILLITNFRCLWVSYPFFWVFPGVWILCADVSEHKIQTPGNHLTKNTTYERDGLKDNGGGDWRGKGGHREPYPGNWKGKGKGHPRTGHEVPERE